MSAKLDRGRGIGGCLLVLFVLFLVGCYLAHRQGINSSKLFRSFTDAIGL